MACEFRDGRFWRRNGAVVVTGIGRKAAGHASLNCTAGTRDFRRRTSHTEGLPRPPYAPSVGSVFTSSASSASSSSPRISLCAPPRPAYPDRVDQMVAAGSVGVDTQPAAPVQLNHSFSPPSALRRGTVCPRSVEQTRRTLDSRRNTGRTGGEMPEPVRRRRKSRRAWRC